MKRSERIDARRARRRAQKPLQMTARARSLRCPASKARLRAELIKGRGVEEALSVLRNSPSSASRLITKVLYSAMHNAVNGSQSRDPEDLVVQGVQVDHAGAYKRHKAVSHGVAKPILKRMCHIRVILGLRKGRR
jgi:large subunit ribosomal protein L22